jgi:hypothetical protein
LSGIINHNVGTPLPPNMTQKPCLAQIAEVPLAPAIVFFRYGVQEIISLEPTLSTNCVRNNCLAQ